MSNDFADLAQSHVSEEEVVEICRDLVRAKSENPPGDETEVAQVTERWLSRLGLPSERFTPAEDRPSVTAAWGSGERTLLFNGHYDVVPASDPDAWPSPPFAAEVSGGHIVGRGSADMKAGIAACLAAVSGLQRAGFDPGGRLLMHFVADEEALGTHGTRAIVESGLCDSVTEAIVGEPTALNLVTCERGVAWLRVVTEGISAHGSAPQLGVNAIEHMSRVVQAVSGIRWRKLHELLGAPTLSIGTIHGGTKVNVVADHCEIEIDRRTLPGETNEEILAEVEAAIGHLDIRDLKARVELMDGAEASVTEPGEAQRALHEASKIFGEESVELGYMGATDARFLINQVGVPAIICGPGDLRVAHTTGESVSIAELVRGARMYAYAFAKFLS